MDSTNLSKVEQLRGFKALRENQFFVWLMEGMLKEQEVEIGLVLKGDTLDTNNHFRSVGKAAALTRTSELLDATIRGLDEEVRQEQEGQVSNGSNTDPEPI